MVVVKRNRRGVYYNGVERDVQVVLRMFVDKARDLRALLQRRRNAYLGLISALEYVRGNHRASSAESAQAQSIIFTANAQLTVLNPGVNRLTALVVDLQTALRSSVRANNHTPVLPDTLGLVFNRPSGTVRIQKDLSEIRKASLQGWEWFLQGEKFLKQVEYLVRPDLMEQCRGSLRPPRPPDPDGGDGGNGSGSSWGGGGGAWGVMAGPRGRPEGIRTAVAGYRASAETQARLFAKGTPIAFNLNHRYYKFSDGSYVTIQAHVPVLTTGTISRLASIGIFFGFSAVGALGGPKGLAVGMGLGIATVSAQPNNAAWQGYTARYYSGPNARTAPRIYRFYGWKAPTGIWNRVSVGLQYDPDRFPNFADDFAQYSWHVWRPWSPTQERAPVFDGSGLAARQALRQSYASLNKDVELLLQDLGSFATAISANTAKSPHLSAGLLGADKPPLLADHSLS